ncbi:hypothetical protein COEREDRAFT_88998 [Coemansia reversa NRRL 1564]|uniref:Calcium channel YVC1-like C-terminal transmembrane domain-containing protein n=1 Tax=Coemansia reversa (strain ATCC 12441 / NRRL 1564) TaxID=763665 RepID=A0A2G5B579_COERN|nr:hypothetical protein COEREDRAFT_88998 [Coemansia reversa NRRL 1564]|eukprot:PIA14165.1 hypothetical protein COEREDRAFT_88998 [Coemansia reversa NRRL 1564]
MEHPTRNDGRRQASTALLLGMRMRQGEPHNMQTGGIADLSGYGTTDSSRLLETHVITENNAAAYEIADDSNPVSAYFEILSIRRLLLEHVDVVLSPGQIHTPDVQLNLVSPLWQATPSAGQSQAELHGSRAEVAESLAILCAKALHKLGNRALINALCVKYTPIDTDGLHAEVARVLLPADNLQSNKVPLGSRLPIRGDRHMSLLSPDQRVRVYRLGRAGHLKDSAAGTPIRTTFNEATTTRGETGFITPFRELAKDYLSGGSRIVAEHAIEVAIRSEAKRFTAQTLVGEVVYMLWDGTLHWKGFHCTSLLTSHNATNTTQQQCNSTLSFLFERRGSVGSDTEACEATEYGGELDLTQIVSLRRQEELSIEEVIMHVLFTGSEADLDKAYDVLALNASMLWPRLFAVLDQFEFCGTIIIQVRRIIAGTSLFFALLLAMTMGFFQTFYALSRKHNELDAKNIWGLMTRIFFGSALLGWDQADLFGPYVGYLVMATYIGVSMLILYNILIGVINQCMMEIERNAAEEFRFAYTMRVAEYIIIFWPLRFRHCYRWWRERSGTQNRALRTECHLAEKELALIKICKDDIDEFAFSGSTDDTASEDGSSDIGYTAFGNSGGGESQTLGNGWSRSSVPVIATDSCLRNLITSPTLTIGTNASNSNTDSGISGRWASLMNAWRSRNNHAKNLSPQSPRWSSTDALDSAAHINPQPADALHAIAEKENHIQTTKKLTQLQTQVTEIDKKLTNIARLLQPVTDRD